MIWKKKKFWGTLIALALLAYCVKDIGLDDLRALGDRLNPGPIIPAIFATYAFVVFKAWRWKVLISPHKKTGAWRIIPLFAAGQILNVVMPALTGQVGRMFLFANREGLRKTFVFSTIILEVVFDAISLVTLLFLTSLAFAFPDRYRTAGLVIALSTAALVLVLYILLHYQPALERYLLRHFRDRWPGLYIGILKGLRSFTKGFDSLRSSQHCLISFALSVAAWLAHAAAIWFLLRAFGFSLPLAAAAVVVIVNTVALMVPITPGNAGTFEIAVVASLAAFRIGRPDAVLFAVALHLLDFLPIFTLGFIFLRSEKVSIMDLKARHEDEWIQDHVSENGLPLENEEEA